jgi:hypothetical protein
MTPQRKLEELRATKASLGWHLMAEKMREEIVQLALMLARTPGIPAERMDFFRGAIDAAEKLVNLPDALINLVENELIFDETQHKRDDTGALAEP